VTLSFLPRRREPSVLRKPPLGSPPCAGTTIVADPKGVRHDRFAHLASFMRRRNKFALFSDAAGLLFIFFVHPIISTLFLAFTDMGRTLKVTGFTLANIETHVHARQPACSSSLAITFIFGPGHAGILQPTCRAAAGVHDYPRCRRRWAPVSARYGCCRG